ncbi:DUF4386 domain-containing protein [Demequina sp. SYSU T00039]|uniref:DUF4386 domain-containing protein n=1 Tax=Demequina lignilytica TaxID=3051663 RepID=A0AAW7M443_9MICO|nr:MULTISPECIES: DUF4386 domain-containing protein [unclassified Demequina]MDN4479280.1 DUF4386 domain-containing protein [Demequina sp. SYSU T00039-1]MDN4488739.1 DUF4386 domain-containing protein [Demequina sp. SYSU T00039]
MSRPRRTAALAGAFYLLTHLTSVAAVILYGPMVADDAWLAGSDGGGPQLLGALLDIVLAVAVVGTALCLLPLLRAHAPLGGPAYLVLRVLEAAVIVVGAASVAALVSLRDAGLADGGAGVALRELYSATFLVGAGLVVGVHTVVLAVVLWRLRAVPRWIPVLGVVGSALVTASNLTVMFGLADEVTTARSLAAIPIFLWEISLAITLIVRGLRLPARTGAPEKTAVAAAA